MIKYILAFFSIFILAANADSKEISKSDWLKYMASTVPSAFCQEGQYFRQCFEIPGSTCLDTARKAIKICIDKEKQNLPESLDQVTGEQWGNIIGTCAGSEFEKIQINSKFKNQKCYNPTNWMK